MSFGYAPWSWILPAPGLPLRPPHPQVLPGSHLADQQVAHLHIFPTKTSGSKWVWLPHSPPSHSGLFWHPVVFLRLRSSTPLQIVFTGILKHWPFSSWERKGPQASEPSKAVNVSRTSTTKVSPVVNFSNKILWKLNSKFTSAKFSKFISAKPNVHTVTLAAITA